MTPEEIMNQGICQECKTWSPRTIYKDHLCPLCYAKKVFGAGVVDFSAKKRPRTKDGEQFDLALLPKSQPGKICVS